MNKELKELKALLKEKTTELEAWHEVFGTSQLTHAKAKMESFESDRKELIEAFHLEDVEKHAPEDVISCIIATYEISMNTQKVLNAEFNKIETKSPKCPKCGKVVEKMVDIIDHYACFDLYKE